MPNITGSSWETMFWLPHAERNKSASLKFRKGREFRWLRDGRSTSVEDEGLFYLY
jgi:hypothetical protein